MLEVFEDAGVHPKAANDLCSASARIVACHSDRSRPGVGDEMLKSAGKSGWSGNEEKTARRMTQPQVRTRSDVSTRLARISRRLSTVTVRFSR